MRCELITKTIYGEKRCFFPQGLFCADALPQRLHRHHEPEIHLLSSGEAEFLIEEDRCTLHAGGLLVIPAGMFHCCEARSKDALHLAFRLDGAVKRNRLYALEPAVNEAVFAAACACADTGDAVELAALIALLCSRFCVGKPPQLEPIEDYATLVSEFFSVWYSEAVRLTDFAQELKVSARHAERLVLQHTGKTFREELAATRAGVIRQLLAQGESSEKAIAQYVGLRTVAKLRRLAEKYGITLHEEPPAAPEEEAMAEDAAAAEEATAAEEGTAAENAAAEPGTSAAADAEAAAKMPDAGEPAEGGAL